MKVHKANLNLHKKIYKKTYKAYITCPATCSQAKLPLLPIIKTIIKEKGIEPFVFHIGTNSKEIFKRDMHLVKSCQLIVAEVSEPSHGVGIELGVGYCMGHSLILLHEKGKKISRLAKGLPNAIILEYKNIEDLKKKLNSALEKLKTN